MRNIKTLAGAALAVACSLLTHSNAHALTMPYDYNNRPCANIRCILEWPVCPGQSQFDRTRHPFCPLVYVIASISN